MGLSSAGDVDPEIPAMLRLRTWELQLDLSSFRQAFISPSRELLLLHSCQSEALIIPLVKGRHVDTRIGGNDLSSESDVSRYGSHPFISDVKSLAWGICEDTYNQQEEALFREFLFVCGDRGVMVHAFLHWSGDIGTKNERSVEVGIGFTEDGNWMEWGPTAPLDGNMEALGKSDSAIGDACCITETSVELSRNTVSRRWLSTFLTSVETEKSKDSVCTRYPRASSFPSSAMVVSFSLFGPDSPVLGFLVDDSAEQSVRSSCKVSRVFFSNSHHFIGFVVGLANGSDTNMCGENCNNTALVVARLMSQGIHWVCLVKLSKNPVTGLLTDWMDFGFSTDFLICLNVTGLILVYGVLTGEYLACLDILHICRVNAPYNCQDNLSIHDDSSPGPSDGQKMQNEDIQRFRCNRKFKRLLLVSHTSLFGVVDEHGVIYVACVDDHVPGSSISWNKLLYNSHHSGIGIVIGWDISGATISHPRIFSNIPGGSNIDMPFLRVNTCPSKDNGGMTKLSNFNTNVINKKAGRGCSYIKGFTYPSDIPCEKKFFSPESLKCIMRKIFVPRDKFVDNDTICLSPFGVTRLIGRHNVNDQRKCSIIHTNFLVDYDVSDDRCTDVQGWEATIGEAIGCSFQGCFYLVTERGLSVVFPSVSVSSDFLPVEAFGCWQQNINSSPQSDVTVEETRSPRSWSTWKTEVLDRVLLYEGPEEADQLCMENGWDLRLSRIRRLQLALYYLQFEEIEASLEMLVGVNLEEEGILRVLFYVVCLMIGKVSSDNEGSAASRLLALATCFATKIIRAYGLLQHKEEQFLSCGAHTIQCHSPQLLLAEQQHYHLGHSNKLKEMAYYLEIIRDFQCQLHARFKKPRQPLDGGENLNLVDAQVSQEVSELNIDSTDILIFEASKDHDPSVIVADTRLGIDENLLLMSVDNLEHQAHESMETTSGKSIIVCEGSIFPSSTFPKENPKDMIERWEINNLNLKDFVEDALFSGRLPLAVLKLHLHRLRDLGTDNKSPDTFSEVRDAGRTIVYDLLLKGETRLAVTTLQKLGEDIDISLKQLLFATVRRSLRRQIAEEMKNYGSLGPYECKMLEIMSLIERVYTCSSFWRAFCARRKELAGASSMPTEIHLDVLHPKFGNCTIACGEIDGIVLGSWINLVENPLLPEIDDDSDHAGYWAAAGVWFDAWEQRTVDRILLDQPSCMGVNVLWESQLEYQLCHNNWFEVSKLLNAMPSVSLSYGSLQISLDVSHSDSAIGRDKEIPDYVHYVCPLDELDTVCMDVPGIRICVFSVTNMCSEWLRSRLEQQLAKNFIFLKEYWEGGTEILSYLARSGFISGFQNSSSLDESHECSSDQNSAVCNESVHPDTVCALHKLVLHHCIQYNLPNFLALYLDNHGLGLDHDSLSLLLNAAGHCEWARWLLLIRAKGHEYEASFSNARSISSQILSVGNHFNVPEIGDRIRTVDDIAEGAGEMAALATLMYAPIPIQDCLNSGGVNRNCSSQCTLDNLRPVVQHFPMLWRALISACFGQDPTCNFFGPKTGALGFSELSDYLNWRDTIFFSSERDTSLLQMLPCWFSKSVRRLLQLYIQGPLGWQSVTGLSIGEGPFLVKDMYYSPDANQRTEVSAIGWEAAINKHIEKELYAASMQDPEHGLEHHLHRGHALAAFNQILATRVHKMKLETARKGKSETIVPGQSNIQSDVHAILAPTNQNEETFLSSVIPLSILHFEDSTLVASCAFLLELCGLSTSMLRIDVAALRRISSFYRSDGLYDHHRQSVSKGSKFHLTSIQENIAESLAQGLADDYVHFNEKRCKHREDLNISSKEPSAALMLVLHHLEKASLPMLSDGLTCGSWLLSGEGDGTELRSQQKAASQHWHLVTEFCHVHQIPSSTKYLAVLAQDNDWVGFLSEAQKGGYSFHSVIQVASKEFSDPPLRVHMLTVLRVMQSKKKFNSLSNSDIVEERDECPFSNESLYISAELFGVVAECERQKYPGQAILLKAKDLCWSILAVIASCFADVSPLSCLTVWLEITAARDTSSIKVNGVAAKIASNVCAAVEATNSLPPSGRTLSFHYNRRNPKRRCLMELVSIDSIASSTFAGSVDDDAKLLATQGIMAIEGSAKRFGEHDRVSNNLDEVLGSLSKLVAMLCELELFHPLLRAFEMFLPSCAFLSFIRALQAFSQMRLAEASAHLGSFSSRIKEDPPYVQTNNGREEQVGSSWISSIAMKAADAMILTCPSPYEKRCLLQLLAATDFGDGGHAASCYQRLYWKINLAEPSLRKDDELHLGNEILDDESLLTALEENGHWEHARNWARQMEASVGSWKSSVHNVTEAQAESMVTEWKEFLWDVPAERVALWGHCQTLFIRYSFPALQAGLFFLRHAEALEKDLPPREVHEILILSLQWLSGMISQSNPVYPSHLLREIETRVWLLAVESEAQVKNDGEFSSASSSRDLGTGKGSNVMDHTASFIAKMDNHINSMKLKNVERNEARENHQTQNRIPQMVDSSFSTGSTKVKRKTKGTALSRRPLNDAAEKSIDSEDCSSKNDFHLVEDNYRIGTSISRWEERLGAAEVERAVLSLLEFGQITAAKELQHKLSPGQIPYEFLLVDAAKKLGAVSILHSEVSASMLDDEVYSVLQSHNLMASQHMVDPKQVLENLSGVLMEGRGRGLCKRIISVVKAAKVLGLSFSEAFDKQPVELLQLLSLKAQDSFEEANLLVHTHSIPAASIAQILAESFLKGLLAAHRGGYMDSQKEEGPAPLLWRFSDFLKWAELCPSEPEIGHALMRLVITGQEIPHACEVELLILSHHFYKLSSCLDGVDVLVALAATRVEAYVTEGDFSCLARLVTGVGNFHALNFILGILIENNQLDLLLQKYSAAADTNAATAEAVRGFRMAVLTSLKQFNPNDSNSFAMVYNHFDMKHETAALLEARAEKSSQQWFLRYDKDQNEDLLESMRYFIEAAEVYSSIDAGNKTCTACARASLVSLQIRMPDYQWLKLSETNARRLLVEQSRFQEALIVAEAYDLNQPSEWALVLWNQMLKPELTEQFVAEFVAVLPLQPSMLTELARFYRAEVVARGDQSHFSVWLTGGGLPAEWAKYLGRSFRCLLRRTRDLTLRFQLATLATGFGDVMDACMKALDRIQDPNAPLLLRKGHGGAYLPLM